MTLPEPLPRLRPATNAVMCAWCAEFSSDPEFDNWVATNDPTSSVPKALLLCPTCALHLEGLRIVCRELGEYADRLEGLY